MSTTESATKKALEVLTKKEAGAEAPATTKEAAHEKLGFWASMGERYKIMKRGDHQGKIGCIVKSKRVETCEKWLDDDGAECRKEKDVCTVCVKLNDGTLLETNAPDTVLKRCYNDDDCCVPSTEGSGTESDGYTDVGDLTVKTEPMD